MNINTKQNILKILEFENSEFTEQEVSNNLNSSSEYDSSSQDSNESMSSENSDKNDKNGQKDSKVEQKIKPDP